MEYYSVSMTSEADAFVVAKIRQLVSPELKLARNPAELRQRLTNFGYDIQSGYLVTAPQGKQICPMSML